MNFYSGEYVQSWSMHYASYTFTTWENLGRESVGKGGGGGEGYWYSFHEQYLYVPT